MTVLNPYFVIGFDRIHRLANTATEADVQAALNDARYDVVALEAGAWASPFAVDLTVPAGKILMGFSWTGDADDLAEITFTGTAQVLLNGSKIEGIKFIHLNTRTANLIVGSGDGGWAERVYVITSDGSFYNYWAFSGTWRWIRDCGTVGLKGIYPAAPADVETGRPQISNFRVDGISNANSVGVYFDATSDRFMVNNLYISNCDTGFQINGADDIDFDLIWILNAVDDGIVISNTCTRITGTRVRINGGATGSEIATVSNSTFSDFVSIGNTGRGFDIGNNTDCGFSNFHVASHRNVGIYIDYNNRCTFTGMSAGGGTVSSSGFFFNQNTNCDFTTIVASNNRGSANSHGITVSTGTDCRFTDLYSHLNQGSGFYTAGNNVVRCHFNGVFCRDNDVRGIHIYTAAGIQYEMVFDGVVSSGNGTDGIYLGGATECVFRNVLVQDNGGDGIETLASCTRCEFRNIRAFDNAGFGFNAANVVLFANRCVLAGYFGNGNGGATETSLGTNWITGRPHGAFFVNVPAATTTIAAYPAAWYTMQGTTTLSGFEEEFDDGAVPASNALRFSGRVERIFRVSGKMSFTSDTGGITVYIGLFRNGVLITGSIMAKHIPVGANVEHVASEVLVQAFENNTFSIGIASSGAGAQITAEFAELVAEPVCGF